jgi:hypothetical protein
MPFYYSGGTTSKIDLRNEIATFERQGGYNDSKTRNNYYTSSFKGNFKDPDTFKRIDGMNVNNNTLDSAITTGFKDDGVDIGNGMTAKVISFYPNKHRDTITFNEYGVDIDNYNNNAAYTFGNDRNVNIPISEVYNQVAFIVQGAGGGGAFSNESNNAGWSGSGGGGGGFAATGKLNTDFTGRNFNITVGSGGRGGVHWRYTLSSQGTAMVDAQSGGLSRVNFNEKSSYIIANGGGGGTAINNTNADAGDGGNTVGTSGFLNFSRSGNKGEVGRIGAGYSTEGGNGGGQNRGNSGSVNSIHFNNLFFGGGPGNSVNNQPGDSALANYNRDGRNITWTRNVEENSAGGGGGGAGGNNSRNIGSGRWGHPGGHGGDGQVIMFLYT